MTSSRVASDLAAFLVPAGVVGAVLAVVCAVVAAVAIVRGAGGLTGGAVGVWIPSALTSLLAGFANQWVPLIVSGAALVGMLVIGAVVRAIVTASGYERPEKTDAVAALPVAASTAEVPSPPSTLTRPTPVRAT